MAEYPMDQRDYEAVPADENGTVTPKLTRRQILISGAAASAALGGLTVLRPLGTGAEGNTPTAANGADYLAGVIAAVEASDTLQLRANDGTRTVKIRQGAAVHRAASVADGGSAFAVGEEIVAEGAWTGAVFAATALHTMHRVIETRVVAREGQQVRTDNSVIMLTSETRPRDGFAGHALPLDQIVPGTEVAVLGRTDPRTGTLVAEFVSDRSHGSQAR